MNGILLGLAMLVIALVLFLRGQAARQKLRELGQSREKLREFLETLPPVTK